MTLLIIQILLVLIALLAIIYYVVIAPLWFKYKIIPTIEKRLGEKIKFCTRYELLMPFPFGARIFELALYISFAYIGSNFWKTRPRQALNHVNYKIEEASKAEIVASILTVVSCITAVIIATVFFFFPFKN